MNAIVGSISEGGQAGVRGEIGDEDPRQAIVDALAQFRPMRSSSLCIRPMSRTGGSDG
jgi:hypothetical protein